jgi:enamine deaminase RidA (YjgF/YER057c/UK114 family)
MNQHNPVDHITVHSYHQEGVECIQLQKSSYDEFFLAITPTADEDFNDVLRHLTSFIQERNIDLVSLEIFGVAADAQNQQALAAVFPAMACPVTWLQHGKNPTLCGIQAWGVKDVKTCPIHHNNNVIGTVIVDPDGLIVRLGGIAAEDIALSRTEQTARVFEIMENALQQHGMSFHHVIRTWFYNHDILDWYGDFNKARDTFFKANDIYSGLVPASTGIGGPNHFNAALTCGLLAMKSDSGTLSVKPLVSPLQCPALEYGSSFSRAVELTYPDHRRVFVSGTASIEPGGATLHIDDVPRQIELTMNVVSAILRSRRMDWSHVTRAIAYFKDADAAHLYKTYCDENQLPHFPVVITENDVCRDDLLYEIEVDAILVDAMES